MENFINGSAFVRHLTESEFQAAVELAKQENPQAWRADIEMSYLAEDGIIRLMYDPFPGNWRLSSSYLLATVRSSQVIKD